MKKHRGLHTYRFKDNPEEKAFADAWAKQDKDGKTLAYLLTVGDQQGRPAGPLDDEHRVAATVIQWLGSPVGQCFLRDLGYEKKKAERVQPEKKPSLWTESVPRCDLCGRVARWKHPRGGMRCGKCPRPEG